MANSLFSDYASLKEFLSFPCRKDSEQAISELTRKRIQDSGQGLLLRDCNLSGLNLRGVDLRAADFSCTNLENADLTSANLSESILIRTTFQKSNLSKAILSGSRLQNCSFSESDLSQTIFCDCRESEQLRFERCILNSALFQNCFLIGFSCRTSTLDRAAFHNTKLRDAVFFHTNLTTTIFKQCELIGITFNSSRMDNCLVEECLGERLSLEKMSSLKHLSLLRTNLPGTRITDTIVLNLRSWLSSLRMAQFSNSQLFDGEFDLTDLTSSNWFQCQVTDCSFVYTRLNQANLHDTIIKNGHFSSVWGTQLQARSSNFVNSNIQGIQPGVMPLHSCFDR